jgi:hypothetical protein
MKPHLSPRDFFLHLLTVIFLYISAGALLMLAFRVINTVYPKVAQYSYQPSISWQVATLIIVFPLFLLLSWVIQRDYKKHPDKKNLAFRKWLIYITLFVTALALVGDLVTVLYYFLDGQDLTAGFLLKALAVLVVAGGIFKYYIFELAGWYKKSKNMLFAIGSAVLVLAMIIWGFSVMGSPQTQRMVRYDQMKVDHLNQIQSQIVGYYQQKQVLPESLTLLNDPISSFMLPKDPQTNTEYIYQKTGNLSFKLCADFNRESKANGQNESIAMPIGFDARNANWQHGAGEVCFDRTIDPDLYPPLNKPIR